MTTINVCPGTLAPGFDTYSPSCLRKVFGGRKVSHILDFNYDHEEIASAINRISISGVQEKLSAIVADGKISLAPDGVSGRYIIKPAPDARNLRFRADIPANEHLTMQIANQVYELNTADNALIFFADGVPAYITKRFDYAADGTKILQDDFASLSGKTQNNSGKDYKYTGSYEDVAVLLRKNVAAWRVEMTKYFAIVVFNYLFANGDAHLKNFSLQATPDGDYILSPAYDLMNTSIHIDDGDFALTGGLIPQSEYSEVYAKTGHPCKDDFVTFGNRIGVVPQRITSILEMFATEQPEVYNLIDRSFLSDKTRRMYRHSYQERLRLFQRSDGSRTE